MKATLTIIFLLFIVKTGIGQNSILQQRGLHGIVKSIKDDYSLEEFDKNGDCVSRTLYEKGQTVRTIQYKYKAPGQVSETITYDASGNQMESGLYEYDVNNNPVNYTTRDKSGKLLYQETRSYTDKLHYIARTSINGNTKVADVDTITLDNSGRKIMLAKNYFGTYRVVRYTYQSNHSGPILVQTIDNGKMTYEEIYVYNDNGDLVEATEKSGDQSQTTIFEYKYDKYGNYTRRTSKGYENNSHDRKIKYY